MRKQKKQPSKAVKRRAMQRQERRRQSVRDHRERQRQGMACYLCAIDAAVLDWLVQHHYLTDTQVLDRTQVNRAISALLLDISRT